MSDTETEIPPSRKTVEDLRISMMELRAKSAYCDADTKVNIVVCDTKLLELLQGAGVELVAVTCYPNSNRHDGKSERVFNIEVRSKRKSG
jgi:hypothetical protein